MNDRNNNREFVSREALVSYRNYYLAVKSG